MPPVKMTRQQYEAQYGVKPVSTSANDFDTSPAPLRMTRAEYNATYRPTPQTYGQTFKQDIADIRPAQQEAVSKAVDTRAGIEQRQATGEISPTKAAFQKFGTGLLGAADVVGQTLMGGIKAIIPDKVEARIGETLGKDIEKILAPETRQAFIDKLKESEGGVLTSGELDRKAGLYLEEVGNAYKNDENFRNDVQSAGGILSWLALPGTARNAVVKSAETVSEIADAAKPSLGEIAQQMKESVPKLASQERRIVNQADDILAVETKYNTLRKINEQNPKAALESRMRIAESNVLEGAVDENGRIDTTEAIKVYRKDTIDGREDIVRTQLEAEGNKINLKELELDMKAAVLDSGLEGGSLYTAIKGIEKQIKGLSVRADAFGDVPLHKLQDAKIAEYKSLDYSKVNQSIYKKTLARVYKEAIERKSNLEVKAINAELAKFYSDIDRLEKLNGKIVEGGKLGKYGASIVGTGVGMAGGSILGGGGAAVGGMIGGELAQRLKGKSMASTFGRGIKGNVPESEVLKAAASANPISLKVPNKKVGVPSGIKKTPEMTRVEAQIAKNVEAQKKAIAASDFTLVAELKTIYTQLVEKLKVLIEDYKKNGVPIGMSIRKSVTPESVAKKADATDISVLAKIVDDPIMAKLDDNTKRMISDMGLARATDDELVSFAKEVINEYDLNYRSNLLMSDQKNAINPPTKAQSISDTVDNTGVDVNGTSPQTTPYFADPRKIPKTEDEFIKAHTLYHGANTKFADQLEKTKTFKPGAKRDAGTGGNLYGLSATTDFKMAKDFSTSATGSGRVVELYIDPRAKVLNMESKALDDLTEAETRKLAKEYDVIRDIDNVGGESEVRILNSDVLRDRSQIESAWVLQEAGITNLYKQADNVNTPQPTSLLEEAKKYKSAEEFVKGQGVTVYHGSSKSFESVDDIDFENEAFYTLKRPESQMGALDEIRNPRVSVTRKDIEKYLSDSELNEYNKISELSSNPATRKDVTAAQDKRWDALVKKVEDKLRQEKNIDTEAAVADWLSEPATAFGKNVNEFVVDFKNPLIVDAKGRSWMDTDGEWSDWTNSQVRKAKKIGNDGVIIRNINEGFSSAGTLGAEAGLVDDYIVLSRESINTPTELKAIWNKANAK